MSNILFGRKYSLIIGRPAKADFVESSTPLFPLVVTKNFDLYRIFGVDFKTPDKLQIVKEREFREITDLQIECEIRQTASTTASKDSPSFIKIFNLSDETREFIQGNDVVLLSAGYEQDKTLPYIFTGQVSYVTTERVGSDNVTTLICGKAITPRRNIRVSRSYPAGTAVHSIMSDLVAILRSNGVSVELKMFTNPDIPVFAEGVDPFSSQEEQNVISLLSLTSGYTIEGNIFEILDNFASTIGVEGSYRVYFVDDVLHIEDTLFNKTKELFILNANNTKNIEKVTDTSGKSSMQATSDGVVVTTFLDGRIKQNKLLQITFGESQGTYEIEQVTHKMSYEGNKWKTETTARLMDGLVKII